MARTFKIPMVATREVSVSDEVLTALKLVASKEATGKSAIAIVAIAVGTLGTVATEGVLKQLEKEWQEEQAKL